uniref:Uncharacterized protein n=1 Tax=Arundo donax TaxID=35708 RepID=A0A0A9GB29_ARUDO
MILAAPQEGLKHLETHRVVIHGEDPHADGELVPHPPHRTTTLLRPHVNLQTSRPKSQLEPIHTNNPTNQRKNRLQLVSPTEDQLELEAKPTIKNPIEPITRAPYEKRDVDGDEDGLKASQSPAARKSKQGKG